MYPPSKNALTLMMVGATIYAALQCVAAFLQSDYTWVFGSGLLTLAFGLSAPMVYLQPKDRQGVYRSYKIGFILIQLFITLNLLFIRVVQTLMTAHNSLSAINEVTNWQICAAAFMMGAGFILMLIENLIIFYRTIND